MTVPVTLTRYAENPVLVPSMHNAWESDNVFNAAVIRHNGLVYMHYRAQGRDRVSRIGCAISTDGYTLRTVATARYRSSVSARSGSRKKS